MRITLLTSIAPLALSPAAAPAAPRTPAVPALTRAGRAEIDSLLRRWEKAWEDGDAVAWSNLFTEDGTWVLWTGGEWRGWAQIARYFATPFATVYKASIQKIRLVELRPLARDVAVARIRSTTAGDTRQPGVTIHATRSSC